MKMNVELLGTHCNPFRKREDSRTRVVFVRGKYFGLWGASA